MDVLPVLELLREKIGLNSESIGATSVAKAIQEQIALSGAASVEAYIKKVSESAEELSKLVEAVVVQETFFFRNQTPFLALQRYLKQFFLSKNKMRHLRMLCLPCSTGEEAYSIAMALFDMELMGSQFTIHAADISKPVLQFAEAGSYSSYSFRGKDTAYKKKYFVEQANGTYLLNKEVREVVHFEQVNILSEYFLRGHKPYDIIFCRNLLIYFDDAAKAKAITALSDHLSDEGVLFVGHAEGANMAQFGFEGLDYPMSFAFARKRYAAEINDALGLNNPAKKKAPPPVAAQAKKIKVERGSEGKKAKLVQHPAQADMTSTQDGAAKKIQIERDIAKARQLADAGSYAAVLAICDRLLAEGVESAEVYFLLGQVAGISGESLMAEEYLKKAIYLNADSYDALIYMSILFGQMGNPDQAATFRKRAQRVKLRNSEDAEQ